MFQSTHLDALTEINMYRRGFFTAKCDLFAYRYTEHRNDSMTFETGYSINKCNTFLIILAFGNDKSIKIVMPVVITGYQTFVLIYNYFSGVCFFNFLVYKICINFAAMDMGLRMQPELLMRLNITTSLIMTPQKLGTFRGIFICVL